jgi:hypothetical protein
VFSAPDVPPESQSHKYYRLLLAYYYYYYVIRIYALVHVCPAELSPANSAPHVPPCVCVSRLSIEPLCIFGLNVGGVRCTVVRVFLAFSSRPAGAHEHQYYSSERVG